MSGTAQTPDVLVVGGGVIGLALAWRARQRGLSVVLLERDRIGERAASGVAAGMLAPVSEAEFGDAGRRVLELGVRSAAMWPDFAAELERSSGIETGLRPSGTLLVARDGDEARELERQLAFRKQLGLRAARLAPTEARELEPALAPTVRLALHAPEDHSVDPRCVLAALRRACEDAGVELREHAPVSRLELAGDDGPVSAVTLAGGERLRAGQIVLAAGAWVSQLQGLPSRARIPVRPLKGQILRLRDPEGPGLLQRVLRFAGGYVVPRGDGRYVLGATVEERDFEEQPTVGGVHELLRHARELLPGVLELRIEELSVGFRPCTPDNVPVIGRGALDGLLWAAGHHRNGILLAPLTAELVVRALLESGGRDALGRDARAGEGIGGGPLGGDPLDPLLHVCDPSRFAHAAQAAPTPGAASTPGAVSTAGAAPADRAELAVGAGG